MTRRDQSLQQLGDVIRLQATEYDRLISGSLDIGKALYAWHFATTVVSDALNRQESAHAAVESLTADVLVLLRQADQSQKPADRCRKNPTGMFRWGFLRFMG